MFLFIYILIILLSLAIFIWLNDRENMLSAPYFESFIRRSKSIWWLGKNNFL